ncbi:MAG: 4-(cytidine 5'-diphospho)-2-C-methyl-D-erythritol kinase [Flaviflexus sp.]|nr:4-(cytidine 5'-diphospho)-2-C-methyl-D-erythritol kinase [Flaviflexus sp.]
MSVHVLAPAKINLALRVGSPRPDGFHPLTTVFSSLDLFDEVVAEEAEGGLEIRLADEVAGVPLGEDNLMAKAAAALRRKTGTERGARLTLTKRIPVAGGMAGGSADAAATLVGLNELWELGLNADELAELAAELGSDVPFSLRGGLALGRGRGEQLSPLRVGAFHCWVLVTSTRGLSTPAVFAAYDELRPEPHEPAEVDELIEALAGPDLSALAPYLINDLTEAALQLRPDLAELLSSDRALATILSGSGPTIGILCADSTEADLLAGALRAEGHTAIRANGPAAGTHVVER